jgi:hypothetical protein
MRESGQLINGAGLRQKRGTAADFAIGENQRIEHNHPSGADQQVALWRSLAEDLALSVPVALAVDFLAVRSRSPLLPTCLHMPRWIP